MNKLNKAITGAAAVAAGGAMLLMTEPVTPKTPVVDDVAPVEVVLPTVEIPRVELPQVASATVSLPAVYSGRMPSAYEARQWGLDFPDVPAASPAMASVTGATVTTGTVTPAKVEDGRITSYQVALPDGKAVTVSSATVAAIVAAVPELADLTVNNPQITPAEILQQLVRMPGVTQAQIHSVAVALVQVADPAARIPLIQQFTRDCQQLFRDQRGIQYDRSLYIDNQAMQRWLEIYKQPRPYQLQHVPAPTGLRMVAEIHHPIDADTLDANLELYSARGYNAALITFGYPGENIEQLISVAGLVRSKGMAPWFAYAGPESLHHSVFYDPVKLRRNLQQFARICDGFLLGWRRTSIHLFEQDQAYIDYVLRCVREGRSTIPVLGEAYFGQTASSNLRTRNLQYNVPANSSAVVVTGLGYHGVAVEAVMDNLLSAIAGYSRIPVITGEKPYYATRFDTGRDFQENLAIKEAIARRWLNAGASGVIVLHGDGSDGIYNHQHNDNLASTKGGAPTAE